MEHSSDIANYVAKHIAQKFDKMKEIKLNKMLERLAVIFFKY